MSEERIERIYASPLLPLDDPMSGYNGFCPSTRVLPKGYVHREGHRALGSDIVWERDVEFRHSDGTKIYVDIFRPAGQTGVPAIVAWSPYGKSNNSPPWAYRSPELSMLQREEGPDPAWWCERGYAVVNPDARGSYRSEGVINMWGREEGRDVREVIEWVAGLDWCGGKVGMAGNSWLAISQWFAAAERPPHLAAIAPWEGMSDVYRESMMRGGIPNLEFPKQMISVRCGSAIDNAPAMAERYPDWNEYWQSKSARLGEIEVPAYIVASYTNALHAFGTFRGWREIASKEKWLRVHNSTEWPDFYEHQGDLERFFAHYLKGEDNGWEQTPRVRMSLLNPGGEDVVERPEASFPPEGTVYHKLYLDAERGTLSPQLPAVERTAAYPSEEASGEAVFRLTFPARTEVAGYMKLEAYVSAEAEDMDIFALVQKADAAGNPLIWADVGDPYAEVPFLGFENRLRVSCRALDPDASTELVPIQSYRTHQPLTPGRPVKIELSIWPAGMVFEAGEQLVLRISGRDPNPAQIHGDTCPELPLVNRGTHFIHCGGACPSYLNVPIIE